MNPENIPSAESAKFRQPRKISPFWLLPVVAFVIGALLFFQILQEQGETITIRFKEGDGISAGKTVIRYQGLQIGQVKKVYFVDNLKEVEVSAEITPEAKSVLRSGTKFWLVKPSASIAGVSGLDALVSGNYITLLPGDGESEDEFIAEEESPTVTVSDGDLLVRLLANDLGSINIGAAVYFRKVPVGTIADYRFTKDQKKVEIEVVINKKYAHLVKQNSRFWNISGVSFSAGLNGVQLSIDSLASVIQGAVAFDSPDGSETAQQGQQFTLYENIKSAQRGIEVSVTLPAVANLKLNETPVFYQNIQIGVLSTLEKFQLPDPELFGTEIEFKGTVKGTLLIDPNYADLLRSESQLLFKEPKFTMSKEQLSKFSELLRGAYFELEAGKGEPKFEFVVQREADFLLSQPNILAFKLTAAQSHGVNEGQGIFYNDIQIGEVVKRQLHLESVSFDAIIFPNYRHLIGANSKFVAISHLDVSFNLDGLRVNAGSPADWVQGGVRVIPGKVEGAVQAQYPLYADIESAEAGIADSKKLTTITLTAKRLSGLGKGSLVLYRDFQVGEVLEIEPKKDHFVVKLFIQPKYRHLLSEKSRFWVEPAVAAEFSTKGLSVSASPLLRSLKGAISFDNQGVKADNTLYDSFTKASSGQTFITLTARDGAKLSQGMPVKYMGLTIGQVESLQLDNANKVIKATAYIDGQYYAMIAKSGSQFRAIAPEISTAGVKNLDAALQNYIQVEAGQGQPQNRFMLQDTDSLSSEYANGLPIVLESSDANGITPQAPVLYRGMQVGVVQRLALSELGDRVLISLLISPKYKHLVRKNSQFWQASGYTMDISLSGASINSGTMSQLLNGGIAFGTPSGKVVEPPAVPNQRFLLQTKLPENAQFWQQGAAQ